VKADNIDMSDTTFKLFTTLFRTKKSKPTTHGELMKLYVGIIKNITCNDIIGSKQNRKRTGGRRNEIDYQLNIDLIKLHLELNRYSNRTGKDFNPDIMEVLEKQVEQECIEFV
jgi:hypothetical protein